MLHSVEKYLECPSTGLNTRAAKKLAGSEEWTLIAAMTELVTG
jgi:hypothetical protein